MSLVGRFFRFIRRRERRSRLDAEIARVRDAVKRRSIAIDEMGAGYCPPDHCCPSCALGRPYTELVAKNERAALWLAILLKRRGRPEDLSLAQLIASNRGWPW